MKHISLQNTHWAYSTLWLCAMIWGGTFVFQKLAVPSVDPLLFNALRSALSAVTLFPFLIIASVQDDTDFDFIRLQELKIGLILGSVLCLALGFQQIGITTTTASKAALITGLYVLLVPLVMKVIFADRLSVWQLGVMLIGAIGLYFLITHADVCLAQCSILFRLARICLLAKYFCCHTVVDLHRFTFRLHRVYAASLRAKPSIGLSCGDHLEF